MQPKFSSELAWQQAEFLMQPIYIRIIDRIRQQGEVSAWKVSYEEVRDPHPINYLCLESEDKQLKYGICAIRCVFSIMMAVIAKLKFKLWM
jgi:hypothetical protein